MEFSLVLVFQTILAYRTYMEEGIRNWAERRKGEYEDKEETERR
jgi:hypothetical protein